MNFRPRQIPAATNYCCCCFWLFQHALDRGVALTRSIDDRWCLGPADLKVVRPSCASVRRPTPDRFSPQYSAEGTTAGAVRSFPLSPPPWVPITNTLTGYRTLAPLASDSPRASRYATPRWPPCRAGAKGGARFGRSIYPRRLGFTGLEPNPGPPVERPNSPSLANPTPAALGAVPPLFYDRDLDNGSPHPSDEAETTRVLTVVALPLGGSGSVIVQLSPVAAMQNASLKEMGGRRCGRLAACMPGAW